EETAKDDEEDKETGKGGDEVRKSGGESKEEEETISESEGESDDEEKRQEEEGSFDPIPRTPKGKEEADELYRDVNINQGRGLQVTQNVEDSHVTLTPVQPDGPQESS
nr:hypothetical protein [Tanacetum cinerariifolium]